MASAPPPVSRTQRSIQRPPALDSSDEARTDTSTSSSMNPARNGSGGAASAEAATATATTASAVAAASSTSSSGRRRKADAAAATGEDKPPPKQRKYERKTKRFIWPDDLHRLFVAAIFDVGLKNASPKALLALMEAAGPNSGLTTEHLKSHLQKYRLNYERSRMEFLEYYDRSAKRNMKRRRQQAQHRASGAGSEANTMFVFPISNSKRRKGRVSDSDSDDSDSDTGDNNINDSSMEVDAKGNATPQGRRESPEAATEAHVRGLSYSQLMQSAQQQPILDGSSHSRQHPQITSDRMIPAVPVSAGMIPIAPQHLPPAYAAHIQRKQASDHGRDLAAAAAAVAAYRYPLGQLPVAGGAAGMPELSDPQWSILNSLMSPQLAGMTGPIGEGGVFPHPQQVSTSEAIARGGSGADGFMLHEEPTDLQMQMHLAMQAQMNLHRQMLTRKVEVAQHLARHSSIGRIDTSTVPNNGSRASPQAAQRGFGESWGSTQHLQQQQYQQQQQQQLQQQQQDHYQQQMDMLSRPSLTAPTSAAPAPVTATNVPPDATLAAPATGEAMVESSSATDGQPSVSAVSDNGAVGLGTETKDDDGMDLYRWDRIDLNVELDDDDLFGFLKS
ncbi:hypothetical protein PHYPSEUDO_014229 [Phytophthora pseudosyringae]|uniref:Myb-like domain-containing protein n=1 Tax=Phytophthora pseudosyringae TaxID=221518 RepID=A0A8T1WF07_9STRA|nr:hypothetical protein PHYPSEUDO_014229 [Phytophthora pseudosyringae]